MKLAESRKYKLTVVLLVVSVLVVQIDAQSACTTLRSEPGVCVPILTCETITQLINLSRVPLPPSIVELVQRAHCGTFNDVHHVCCEPNRVTGGGSSTATSQDTNAVGSTVRIRPSDTETDEDTQSGMRILEVLKCGKSDADRVANGVDANLSEYPWMALLVYSDRLDRTLDCGGSLITDQYVLTAAHCIRTSKKLVSVRLGEHDTTQTEDCIGNGRARKCAPPIQEIDVEEAIYHKDYSASKFSNDIGLIRLVSKATFRSNVQPICLPITPASKAVNLERMIIAGWGRIENGVKANILQKAVVPVRDNDYCQKVHALIRITDGQLCAGGENEIDTCKGDSGGPIFYTGRYRRGARYIQYGVVSAGSSLCGANYPGVYVRVTSYLPWIAANLKA